MKTVCIAGHFNPLHVGHLNLIDHAKRLGDRLIVIVANDVQAKVKRPKIFMSAYERAKIIESIKGVSRVVISIDVNPNVCKTLDMIRPDIFASGCDENHPDAIEEKKLCDRIGITTVYNVGGEKIESSSNLLNKYNDTSIKTIN